MSETKRRTTLTLPASALTMAEKIAAERHVTLSTVVAEALEDGLAIASRVRRADEVLAAYRIAFGGFTEEERLLLDGVDLEPAID
jgi:hypothetical protein